MAVSGRKKYNSKQKQEQSARMRAKWASPEYREKQQRAQREGNTGGHNKHPVVFSCLACGEEIKTTKQLIKRGIDKYCSRICSNRTGKKTGPDRLERLRFRNSIQKQVLERDDYTCQMCDARGVALQVDHIQPWAEYVELRFDINNCRTLCVDCHYKITFGYEKPEGVSTWGHNLSQLGG